MIATMMITLLAKRSSNSFALTVMPDTNFVILSPKIIQFKCLTRTLRKQKTFSMTKL